MKDRKESDSDSGRDCYSMNLMKHCIIFCSMSHAEDYNFYNTNYEGLIFRHFGYNLHCILHDRHSCNQKLKKGSFTKKVSVDAAKVLIQMCHKPYETNHEDTLST